jgi:hypothetical protein
MKQANLYLENHPKKWHSITDKVGEIVKSFSVPSYFCIYPIGSDGRLFVALPHRLVPERTIFQSMAKRNDR